MNWQQATDEQLAHICFRENDLDASWKAAAELQRRYKNEMNGEQRNERDITSTHAIK